MVGNVTLHVNRSQSATTIMRYQTCQLLIN